jgi:hypothetical protein
MNVHPMCVQARHRPCTYCHAEPEQPCEGHAPGVHLCRICLAAHDGLITYRDAASVISDDGFAGWTLILDAVS